VLVHGIAVVRLDSPGHEIVHAQPASSNELEEQRGFLLIAPARGAGLAIGQRRQVRPDHPEVLVLQRADPVRAPVQRPSAADDDHARATGGALECGGDRVGRAGRLDHDVGLDAVERPPIRRHDEAVAIRHRQRFAGAARADRGDPRRTGHRRQTP
jgi:hypothetical protein